jgi:hypothetical protein
MLGALHARGHEIIDVQWQWLMERAAGTTAPLPQFRRPPRLSGPDGGAKARPAKRPPKPAPVRPPKPAPVCKGAGIPPPAGPPARLRTPPRPKPGAPTALAPAQCKRTSGIKRGASPPA